MGASSTSQHRQGAPRTEYTMTPTTGGGIRHHSARALAPHALRLPSWADDGGAGAPTAHRTAWSSGGSRRALLATAQTCSREAPDQLAGGHRQGPRGDNVRAPLLGDVVVVAIEPLPRDSCAFGKGVQLRERDITDEVAPQPPAARPRSRVDKDRHRPIVADARQRMFAGPTKGGYWGPGGVTGTWHRCAPIGPNRMLCRVRG